MRKAGFAVSGLVLCVMMNAGMAQRSYHVLGTDLMAYCKDTLAMMQKKDYNVSRSSWCIGFIQGSVTSHRFYSTFYAIQDPQNNRLSDEELLKKAQENQVFCIPHSVTLGKIVKDVTTYLQTNPQYQKEQASLGVARALHQTYPCGSTPQE